MSNVNLEVKVIAETGDYVVVNKPAGMLVHPTLAKASGTISDWVIDDYPEIESVGEAGRQGIVHRLDREASGVLVIAKNDKMHEHLKRQFQERATEKEYVALVYGRVKSDHDIINFAIDRGREGRMVARPKVDKLRVDKIGKIQPGKEALTEFEVEKRFSRFTLLRVRIHTGRMHQIRVHMFAYGHPVVGDKLYARKILIKEREKNIGRMFLHAARLCFADLSGEKVCFEAELPMELREFLGGLR